MQTSGIAARTSVAGCGELNRMGLADTSECCEMCHSADEPGSLGPCRVALPGGGVARVCCVAKRRLAGKGADSGSRKHGLPQSALVRKKADKLTG